MKKTLFTIAAVAAISVTTALAEGKPPAGYTFTTVKSPLEGPHLYLTILSGINAQGIAVGFYLDAAFNYQSFAFQNGVFTPI